MRCSFIIIRKIRCAAKFWPRGGGKILTEYQGGGEFREEVHEIPIEFTFLIELSYLARYPWHGWKPKTISYERKIDLFLYFAHSKSSWKFYSYTWVPQDRDSEWPAGYPILLKWMRVLQLYMCAKRQVQRYWMISMISILHITQLCENVGAVQILFYSWYLLLKAYQRGKFRYQRHTEPTWSPHNKGGCSSRKWSASLRSFTIPHLDEISAQESTSPEGL